LRKNREPDQEGVPEFRYRERHRKNPRRFSVKENTGGRW
jgi:hypothetical protein